MADLDKNTKRKYSLSENDSNWVNQFNLIKQFLTEIFKDKAIQIEHIGSTSVPGMKAKPIIDVLVVVEKMTDFLKEKDLMVRAGYEWGADYIAPNTLIFFRLGPAGEKLENIHVCEKGSSSTRQFLVMRNFLLAHPDKVKQYSDLKEANSKKYPEDYLAYREAKAPFLKEMEQDAYDWEESK